MSGPTASTLSLLGPQARPCLPACSSSPKLPKAQDIPLAPASSPQLSIPLGPNFLFLVSTHPVSTLTPLLPQSSPLSAPDSRIQDDLSPSCSSLLLSTIPSYPFSIIPDQRTATQDFFSVLPSGPQTSGHLVTLQGDIGLMSGVNSLQWYAVVSLASHHVWSWHQALCLPVSWKSHAGLYCLLWTTHFFPM